MRGLTNLRREVIEDMSSFASGELSGLLKDPDTNWQPQDWLPHPERDDFLDQVRETRANLVDVAAWASEHPGGRTVLEQYAGRDITDAFAAYHGGDARVWARLEAMRAGELGSTRAEAPPKHVKGFRELRDRVEGEKKYLKSLFSDYVFIIGRLVLFFGVTLACVLGEESGFWTHMLGAVSLGLFWQQSMFIGHDAGHNSITFDRNKDAMSLR